MIENMAMLALVSDNVDAKLNQPKDANSLQSSLTN